MSEYSDWIGKTQTATDCIDLWQVRALQNALDLNNRDELDLGSDLPELWHWAFFREPTRRSQQGEDGHAAKGEFLPPIDLPRRMWARGSLSWFKPLKIGEAYTKTSTINDVISKQGRSGPLVFAVVDHSFKDTKGNVCFNEQHHIVYREAATAPYVANGTGKVELPNYDWHASFQADEVLLFRYSSLTYNGHRIHYDVDYAKVIEGYPGLIVHGPLLATLALEQIKMQKPEAKIASFDFKMLSPIFLLKQEILICGKESTEGLKLAIHDSNGTLALDGDVKLI